MQNKKQKNGTKENRYAEEPVPVKSAHWTESMVGRIFKKVGFKLQVEE